MFLSFWWIFCIIITATYSGNLIAFLTVIKEHLPFDTVTGMINQKTYRWGTVGGTVWVLNLKVFPFFILFWPSITQNFLISTFRLKPNAVDSRMRPGCLC